MEIANLVLEYIKVLAWPLLILFVVVYFKSSIAFLLEKMAELNVGGENGFNLKLRAAGKIAERESILIDDQIEIPKQSNLILSLPDEDFLYLNSLAKKSIKPIYFPNSSEELGKLSSLAEYGVMKRKSMSEFELTEIGKNLLASLEKL